MELTSPFSSRIDEAARRRFEDAWGAGRPEPIERFLPPEDHTLYVATLQELVLIDLEMRWKAANRPGEDTASIGPAPRVEDYLGRFPRLNRPEIVRALAEEEYRVREHCGDRPSPAEYGCRFPGVVLCAGDAETVARGADPVVPPPAVRVPGYAVLGVLGRGGMGVV